MATEPAGKVQGDGKVHIRSTGKDADGNRTSVMQGSDGTLTKITHKGK